MRATEYGSSSKNCLFSFIIRFKKKTDKNKVPNYQENYMISEWESVCYVSSSFCIFFPVQVSQKLVSGANEFDFWPNIGANYQALSVVHIPMQLHQLRTQNLSDL